MKIRPFYALFKKECKRFLRVLGQTVITPMINSSLYLFIFGISLGKTIGSMKDVSYLEFLIPGLIMMGIINQSYLNNASSLVISKLHGDVEDLKRSPLKPMEIITAYAAASTVRAFLVAFSIFFISEIFMISYQHSFFVPEHIMIVFFYLFCASFTFGFIGVIVGLSSRSFESLNAISQFILLPLTYLGGIFFPLSILPPLWQKIAQLNPMLYYIEGMRYAFLGQSSVGLSSIVIILFFFCLAAMLAYQVAKRASFRRI